MAIVGFWGFRLGGHILSRLLSEEGEDGRYLQLRRHWGESANSKFFFFFQGQGIANLLLTAPILVFMMRDTAPGLWEGLAWIWMSGSILGEKTADAQLRQWKDDPANRGKTCRRGLWAFSRHPNYFFEWCFWLGLPIAGLSYLPGDWPVFLFACLSPAVMLFLLLRVTGIPYTEKQSLRSRGEDYARYQREVSAFVPWPPKT